MFYQRALCPHLLLYYLGFFFNKTVVILTKYGIIYTLDCGFSVLFYAWTQKMNQLQSSEAKTCQLGKCIVSNRLSACSLWFQSFLAFSQKRTQHSSSNRKQTKQNGLLVFSKRSCLQLYLFYFICKEPAELKDLLLSFFFLSFLTQLINRKQTHL